MLRTCTYARAFVLGALACSLSIAVTASAQDGTVPVTGVVTDASGAVLSGAIVRAVVAGRVAAAATAGDDGRYRVEVPAGVPFEVQVRREGFADYTAGMRGLSDAVTRDVTMRIGGVSDTLVVTASGLPESRATVTSSVTVATADDIHAMGASQLDEVLRFVPGLAVEGTGREGGLVSAFARGGESDYNLVLIDGVRVNTQGGSFDFSRIGAGEIERVEVVRGAQSALWGSDAMGSTVQIFTKRGGVADAPLVSGEVGAGTFGTWRTDARLTGGARGRADYSIGATFRRTAGAFQDILPQDDWFEQTAFAGGLGVTLGSRASLRTSLRSSHSQGRTVGPITFGARDTQGTYDTKNLSWSTDAHHAIGSRYTGAGTVNYFRYEQLTFDTLADPAYTTYAVLEGTPDALFPNGVRLVRLVDEAEFNALVAAGAAPAAGQFLASATSFDFAFFPSSACPTPQDCPTVFQRPAIRYQGDLSWAPGQRLSGGYEWERERFNASAGSPTTTGFALDNHAVFVQQQLSLTDRLFVTAGARVDSREGYDAVVSPKLSAGAFVVPLRPGIVSSVKVFGNIGRGIKSPGFGERFGSGFADPNPDLKVEEARTGDIGVETTFASQRFRAAVTYFNNDYTNQIAYRFGAVGDGVPEFINIEGSEAEGWELEAALLRHAAGFTAAASYSYVDTRVVTAIGTSQQFQPGQPLLRRPRHSGFIRAAYARGVASLHFDLRMVGDRHDNSFLFLTTIPNAQYPGSFTTDITVNPGYTVAGLGLDLRVDRAVTVFVRGNNIADEDYDTALGYPAMPRQAMVGARFNVGWRR